MADQGAVLLPPVGGARAGAQAPAADSHAAVLGEGLGLIGSALTVAHKRRPQAPPPQFGGARHVAAAPPGVRGPRGAQRAQSTLLEAAVAAEQRRVGALAGLTARGRDAAPAQAAQAYFARSEAPRMPQASPSPRKRLAVATGRQAENSPSALQVACSPPPAAAVDAGEQQQRRSASAGVRGGAESGRARSAAKRRPKSAAVAHAPQHLQRPALVPLSATSPQIAMSMARARAAARRARAETAAGVAAEASAAAERRREASAAAAVAARRIAKQRQQSEPAQPQAQQSRGWGVRPPDKVKAALKEAASTIERERAAAAATAAVAAAATRSDASEPAAGVDGGGGSDAEGPSAAERKAAAAAKASVAAQDAHVRAEAASLRLSQLRQQVQQAPLSKAELAEAVELVRLASDLGAPPPPKPALPNVCGMVTGTRECRMPMRQRMRVIQGVISGLEYNHTTGVQHFSVDKSRPLGRLMDTARAILRDALPIKCVEAVFLALYLTAGIAGLERIPLAFKTTVGGHTYRHIVLAVHDRTEGTYGALGISRRKELMYKELCHPSLSELVRSFVDGYAKWWHRVVKVRLGLPVAHELHSNEKVCWRRLTVTGVSGRDWDTEVAPTIDAFAGKAGSLRSRWGMPGDAGATVIAADGEEVDQATLSDGEADLRAPRREGIPAEARRGGTSRKAAAKKADGSDTLTDARPARNAKPKHRKAASGDSNDASSSRDGTVEAEVAPHALAAALLAEMIKRAVDTSATSSSGSQGERASFLAV